MKKLVLTLTEALFGRFRIVAYRPSILSIPVWLPSTLVISKLSTYRFRARPSGCFAKHGFSNEI
jgi:hypothetical protein